MKDKMISKSIEKYRTTGNMLYFLKAAFQVFQQGRTVEILYGVYCNVFSKPSSIKQPKNKEIEDILFKFRSLWFPNELLLSREKLIDIFGKDFLVSSLPSDFAGARNHTIVHDKELLIIGEYGMQYGISRIALVTSTSCVINDYYMRLSRVRHIHAICKMKDSGRILITTGDSHKFLDLWELIDNELFFVKRLRRYLAGYTAIAEVNDHYYFGTDFSDRPNYIETLDRKKFFFPSKAFKKWVLAFYTLDNRYIVTINSDVLGPGRVVSIFDTVEEEFIFCDNISQVLIDNKTKN